MIRTPILLASAGLIGLTACVDPNAYPDDPNARSRNGAIIGGLVGGLAGATSDGDDKLLKTAVGAGIGAIVGGAIGATLDKQAAELRGSLSSNVTVTNNGNYLTVNMPQDLLFATDSATLSPTLQGDLRAVASSLIKYPDSRIEVVGHTDNSGSAAYNYDLSQRRASSVASVLIGAGVPSGRVAAIGRGEDQPIASNLNAAGMAQNRRVEIIIRPNS